MISIADIVDTLANDFPSWRTLSDVRPHLRDGRPIYVTGNAAVTFFVRHKGREKILKCYTRDNPHLATIYGDAFRPRELRVFNMMNRSDFVDCLLTDRIEGITLDRAVCTATSDGLAALADAFDRMAVGLLDREYAHGDLKPENIIVTPDGDMPPSIGTRLSRPNSRAIRRPKREPRHINIRCAQTNCSTNTSTTTR